jgi:hypothetical protein
MNMKEDSAIGQHYPIKSSILETLQLKITVLQLKLKGFHTQALKHLYFY